MADEEKSKEQQVRETFDLAKKLLNECEKDEKLQWVLTVVHEDNAISSAGKATDLSQLMIASSFLHDLLDEGHNSIVIPSAIIDGIIGANLEKDKEKLQVAPVPKEKMN